MTIISGCGTRPSTLLLDGDVDLNDAEELTARGREALTRSELGLVIDLSGVTFLDSTGLGALVGLDNSARAAGKHASFANPSVSARKILRLTGLDQALDVLRLDNEMS